MGDASIYWRLVKIDGAGGVIIKDIAAAQIFFVQVFGTTDDVTEDDIQRQLLQLYGSGGNDAEICLRCFLSRIIFEVCQDLAMTFGTKHHHFSSSDLLPYVLDDRDYKSTLVSSYQPFSLQILQSFNSQRGSLKTWATMKVRQHLQLNKFLLERGIYLVSDWAILNDTKSSQIKRILNEFHHCTDIEIQQAQLLLLCYHQVCRYQHLQQVQTGGMPCKAPTTAQLENIARNIQNQSGRIISPDTVMVQLQELASQLRNYRISVRGRSLPTQSLNVTGGENYCSQINNIAAPPTDDDENDRMEFLQFYEEQFLICLQNALAIVIEAKVEQFRRKKNDKSQDFLTALELLHCQNMSMTDIASHLGMRAQDAVTKLLKLNHFRNDVKREMLAILKPIVTLKASIYLNPEQLQEINEELTNILDAEINTVIENAKSELHNVKSSTITTVFSKKLCEYLDSRNL
jgi:hypothetical protein